MFSNNKELGSSLLELLVAIGLSSVVLTTTFSAINLLKSKSQHQQDKLDFSLDSIKLEHLVAPNKGVIRGTSYLFPRGPGSLRVLRLRLDRILRKLPGSDNYCYRLLGGEKPRAWIEIEAKTAKVIKTNFSETSCITRTSTEVIGFLDIPLSYWPDDIGLMIGVEEFFDLKLENRRIWRESLISRDRLAIMNEVESFTVIKSDEKFHLELVKKGGKDVTLIKALLHSETLLELAL